MVIREREKKHIPGQKESEFNLLNGNIFTVATDILRNYGKLKKELLLDCWRLDYTISSNKNPQQIKIRCFRENLDKARKIYIEIENIGLLDIKKGSDGFKAGELSFTEIKYIKLNGKSRNKTEDLKRLNEYFLQLNKLNQNLKK